MTRWLAFLTALIAAAVIGYGAAQPMRIRPRPVAMDHFSAARAMIDQQHAGNAAAAAGFLTQKPGICLTVSAPGFLNGLTALANATTNCFPMILISGSSEREIVDLQQGDYEEMDQLAIAKPLCKAAFRVLHAQDICVGIARAIALNPDLVILDEPTAAP